jgi:hypothetical protein
LPAPVRSLPGALPTLGAGGSVLAFGTVTEATLESTGDGTRTVIRTADGQPHLVSVAPDGGTVAYAADNQVDAVELTLVGRDGSAPRTVQVTSAAAAATLVPTAWSGDGTAVLVLDGSGATIVDLSPRPASRPSVHVAEQVVLAHGWAVAPDLSRFAMSEATSVRGDRRWMLFDSGDGTRTAVFTRPAADRLMGWRADDRLVWWHRSADGYTVVTTDTAGRSPRTVLRVLSGRQHLGATGTAD